MGGTLGSLDRPERVADLPVGEPTMTVPEVTFLPTTFSTLLANTEFQYSQIVSPFRSFTHLLSETNPPAQRFFYKSALRCDGPLTES